MNAWRNRRARRHKANTGTITPNAAPSVIAGIYAARMTRSQAALPRTNPQRRMTRVRPRRIKSSPKGISLLRPSHLPNEPRSKSNLRRCARSPMRVPNCRRERVSTTPIPRRLPLPLPHRTPGTHRYGPIRRRSLRQSRWLIHRLPIRIRRPTRPHQSCLSLRRHLRPSPRHHSETVTSGIVIWARFRCSCWWPLARSGLQG